MLDVLFNKFKHKDNPKVIDNRNRVFICHNSFSGVEQAIPTDKVFGPDAIVVCPWNSIQYKELVNILAPGLWLNPSLKTITKYSILSKEFYFNTLKLMSLCSRFVYEKDGGCDYFLLGYWLAIKGNKNLFQYQIPYKNIEDDPDPEHKRLGNVTVDSTFVATRINTAFTSRVEIIPWIKNNRAITEIDGEKCTVYYADQAYMLGPNEVSMNVLSQYYTPNMKLINKERKKDGKLAVKILTSMDYLTVGMLIAIYGWKNIALVKDVKDKPVDQIFPVLSTKDVSGNVRVLLKY